LEVFTLTAPRPGAGATKATAKAPAVQQGNQFDVVIVSPQVYGGSEINMVSGSSRSLI